VLTIACGLVMNAAQSQAQMLQWTDRVFASVNVTNLPKSSAELSTSTSSTIYGETAQFSTTQTISAEGGVVADVSGGVRLFHNFGVGAAYTQGTKSVGSANVSARVPHPMVYDQPRTATATVGDLNHKETMFHAFALFMIPFSEKFDIAVFGGPSFFKLEQDTVASPQFQEVGSPYTSIRLTTGTKTTSTQSKTVFGGGADVTYRFMKNLGVGGFVRYAKATFEVAAVEGGTKVSIPMGGFQAGGGVRIRF
jgi:hypothetical protein